MAKSPFPGMDPYLERDWLDVHAALITYIRDQLQDQLPQQLCARMESRVLVEDDVDHRPRERYPDVRVIEADEGEGGVAVLAPPEVAVEPDLFLLDARSEPAQLRKILIYDSQTGGRVVTTIELISPTNKRPGLGQQLYLEKREEFLEGGVNVVEIDLTRGGDRYAILPDLESIQPPPTYVGCVRRAKDPKQTEVYLMRLDQPLKRMRIPLRATDRDAILDLQPLVAQAYDRGRYDRLDYSRPPEPPFNWQEAEIAAALLRAPEAR